MSKHSLSSQQTDHYQQNGYVIWENAFTPEECDAFVAHMMDLQAGRKKLEGFAAREPDNWGRTHNQHVYDPDALALILDPRLRQPLAQCFGEEADAIQTMYFWVGSTQRRHQDAYYLPDCMSAWIALTDVSTENGTIWVQPGSHRGKLITPADLGARAAMEVEPRERYNDKMDELFEQNRREHGWGEVAVEAPKGSVVLFHGHLIHRGGPIGKPGSFRHVMACHYIPHNATSWPYADWPRYTFDGTKYFSETPAE